MKNISAAALKEIFISGANNIANNYKHIDALNVFPIPDGDTGTNMMMTIQSGVKNIVNVETSHCGELASAFSTDVLTSKTSRLSNASPQCIAVPFQSSITAPGWLARSLFKVPKHFFASLL